MSAEHVRRNRAFWNQRSAEYQATHGGQLGIDELTWGVWAIPEAQVGVIGDVSGLDVLELGCGGAQWSVGLAKRGARVTGLDLSAGQLAHARRLVAEHGVDVTLIEGDAEVLPLPDASFDLVFCDHGAMSFTDPRATVPHVARVLRPGGRFVFNMATPLLEVCFDDAADRVGTTLLKTWFDLGRVDEGDAVSFQLPLGEWVRLFVGCGLVIEDHRELRPPPGATTTYDMVGLEWARRWPAEAIWVLRRLSPRT